MSENIFALVSERYFAARSIPGTPLSSHLHHFNKKCSSILVSPQVTFVFLLLLVLKELSLSIQIIFSRS